MHNNNERRIRDIISKPSQALRAMCQGLIEQDKREDFEVDMGTFGEMYADIKKCFGCAATCAISKIANVNFTLGNIDDRTLRARYSNLSLFDLRRFEEAMEYARVGDTEELFNYFQIEEYPYELQETNVCFINANWQQSTKDIQPYIERLEEAGY